MLELKDLQAKMVTKEFKKDKLTVKVMATRVEMGQVAAQDEYIWLDKSAPQGFGNFLKAHIFGLVPFKSVNLIDCSATDSEAVMRTLTWDIGEKCPATILRRSDNAVLCLEPDSAAKIVR